MYETQALNTKLKISADPVLDVPENVVDSTLTDVIKSTLLDVVISILLDISIFDMVETVI